MTIFNAIAAREHANDTKLGMPGSPSARRAEDAGGSMKLIISVSIVACMAFAVATAALGFIGHTAAFISLACFGKLNLVELDRT